MIRENDYDYDKDNNFLSNLKEYFDTHTKEEIEEEWNKTEEWDNGGITVNSILKDF